MNEATKQILDKLSEVSGDAWPILVEGTRVSGWLHIVPIFLVVPIGLAFIAVMVIWKKRAEEAGDVWEIVLGVGLVVLTLGFAISFGFAVGGICDVVNPEYEALQDIIDLVQ